ncbi:MAG: hypothetical protein LBS29_02220 [Endomicrobium sp.]|nr:hypothetical protein [Endomicrobium sp.]
MVEDLMLKRHPISLINLPSSNQDLTFEQLKIYYAEKGKKLSDHFATNLYFRTPEGKYNQLANMFADKNRVFIRLAKWVGTDKSTLIQNEEYGDQCLITALKRVLGRLDVDNITQAKKGNPYRIEK